MLRAIISRWSRFWRLCGLAAIAVYRSGGLGIAKAASYSGLLAFFPMVTAVALVTVRLRLDQAADVISRFFFEVVPPGAREMVARRFTVGQTPESVLGIAVFVCLWAASGLILSLIEGFNAIYGVRRNRSMLHGRLVAIALVFSAVIPGLGATVMMVFGSRTEKWLVTTLGMASEGQNLVGWVPFFGRLIRYLIALGATAATTLLLYRFGPVRRQRTRDVWRGALLATLFWLIATLGFSWYVRNIANYNLLYGGVGAVIVLILWMYLLAVIALFGCAFNEKFETGDNAPRVSTRSGLRAG
ncbi:MAG: YihY/virulence factor BrkB family protein [Bryobacteraceae bacterium]|nr:YihY/virulence factor BrkB family protein [Bryobacteraceae bacterium]